MKPTIYVTPAGSDLLLSFRYDAAAVAAMRTLPQREFRRGTRAWHIPTKDADLAFEALADVARADALRPYADAAAHERLTPKAEIAAPTDLLDQLFGHQRDAVTFLLRASPAKGKLLADDMGLGKTRTAAVAASAMGYPVVIVCPSAVKYSWDREIRSVLPSAAIRVVQNGKPTALASEWTVLNYDIVSQHLDALLELKPRTLIVDESHLCKESSAKRTKAVAKLARASAHVLLLSGTPMKNRARELIPQLAMIEHPIAANRKAYLDRYCNPVPNRYASSGYSYDGTSHIEELRERLTDVMIARKKADVLDLPPKLRAWVPIDIAVREYIDVMERVSSEWDASDKSAANLLTVMTMERVGVSRLKIPRTVEIVKSMLEATSEKILVFTAFSEPLKAIAAAIDALVIDGSTDAIARQRIVDRFQQDTSVRVLAANIQAGGVGLTATAATQVLMHDLVWTPADHRQAEDRAYRIGQSGTVNVTYLVARGTIDETLAVTLEKKLANVLAFEGRALETMMGEMEAPFRKWLRRSWHRMRSCGERGS